MPKSSAKKNLTIDAISAEIEWSKNNRGKSNNGLAWEDGFIEGLKQALYLANLIKKGQYVVIKGGTHADP